MTFFLFISVIKIKGLTTSPAIQSPPPKDPFWFLLLYHSQFLQIFSVVSYDFLVFEHTPGLPFVGSICWGYFHIGSLLGLHISLSAAASTVHPFGSSCFDPAYACPYLLTAKLLGKAWGSLDHHENTTPLSRETLRSASSLSILQTFKQGWDFAA